MADMPQRRWFVPTPGWLLIALLGVEGMLFLADCLRCLPKGYGVLIALGSECVALVLMLLWFAVALIIRLRFQFSLRSLTEDKAILLHRELGRVQQRLK